MLPAQESLRLPTLEEIPINGPGEYFRQKVVVDDTLTEIVSADGLRKLSTYNGSTQRELNLMVSANGKDNWFCVMGIYVLPRPEGQTFQGLQLEVLEDDGSASMMWVDTDGTLKPKGEYTGIKSPEEREALTRLGVSQRAKLPERINAAATMRNFLNSIRRGTAEKPDIVRLP